MNKNLKILYVATKYDYGKPERGLSFEHTNFFDTLYNMGNDILYFDFMSIERKLGRVRMNKLLLDVVQAEKPDLMFVFLSEYELDQKTISKISRLENVITLNWFADDHWRYDNYSRYWAPNFNWVVTTDMDSLSKYKADGYNNAILSQWACNHFLYLRLNTAYHCDVSFIGQAYRNRRVLVDQIRKAGINVVIRGQGWDEGRVSQTEMIEMINSSRINLNFANASVKYAAGWIRPIDRIALYTPGLRRIWRKVRAMIPAGLTKSRPILQIKGRNFEVPGCGGFLLTDFVPELEEFYKEDREVVCYKKLGDLTEKIGYYLENDELRQKIASAGYLMTVRNHTYVHRFNKIFQTIGLKSDFSLEKCPGSNVEIL